MELDGLAEKRAMISEKFYNFAVCALEIYDAIDASLPFKNISFIVVTYWPGDGHGGRWVMCRGAVRLDRFSTCWIASRSLVVLAPTASIWKGYESLWKEQDRHALRYSSMVSQYSYASCCVFVSLLQLLPILFPNYSAFRCLTAYP